MDICRVTAKKVNGKAVFTGRQLKKALAGAKGFVVIGGVIVPVVRLRQYAGVMTKDTLALTVDYSKWVPGIIQIEVPGHRTRFKGVASPTRVYPLSICPVIETGEILLLCAG